MLGSRPDSLCGTSSYLPIPVAPAEAGAHPKLASKHDPRYHPLMGGWTYIMTNGPHGTLYIGVTANLPVRISQHRDGTGSGFCRKHGLTRLVYTEHYDRIVDAIVREKAMKRWKRAWKVKLICQANPHWDDLWEHVMDSAVAR